MIDNTAIREAFNAALPYTSLDSFAASFQEVDVGRRRLQGDYYGSKGYRARRVMEKSGFALQSVEQLSDVVWLGPYRRIFVDNARYGVPFHSSSTMLLANQEPESFISRKLTPNLERLIVHAGTILISCSGTIGNTTIVTSDMNGSALTQDAIRVIPRGSIGVLYCFFQSSAGQYLLTTSKSGGVVEHIYEADVGTLKLPVLPKALRSELDRLIDDSCEMRVNANRLLDEAQEQVQCSCYLPDLKDFAPPASFGDDTGAEMFVSSSKARLTADRGFGEIRLDATYHEPVALNIAKHILASKGGTTLGTLLLSVRRSGLRKRTYVEDASLGVPLIGGKQMGQWRPLGINYLSKVLTRNLTKEQVDQGCTLVSCGGTLGRCQYVHRNYEGVVLSEDVMRITTDEHLARSGFVYAFMASRYGQAQIMQRGYGSVIPRLRDFQFRSIAIRVPDDKGEAIHDTVVRAFDLRADARASEDRAISLFEEAIRRGRSYVEAEWGAEY
jgi:type I restriction enzyme, S subunit